MGHPRANKSSNRPTITEKKRRHWNARKKVAIIMYHENGHSKNKTAANFNIQTNQLRNWISKKPQLLKVQPGVKRLNTGAKPKYPALETALLTWVKEKRKNQNAVTRSMIQIKAKTLAQQRQWQVTCSGIGSFAFSNKWLDGFMRRKNLSNRCRTTVAQRLPSDLIEKQQEFLSYIMYRCIQYDYPLAYIGNMDETPVSFDLPSNTTIDELGTRSVSIRTTGHEKANFTVVLTCMADGTKLPPLIIFKLKNVPRGNFPPEVIIRANQKGWMNENEMLYWIENIWTKRERVSNPQSLLVLDSFSAHIVDSVKRRFGEKNTNIAVIPGGLTSRLQPLDVSVNKSFKTKMRRNYNEWMAEAVKELTPAGNLKKPSYETVTKWVRDSWNAVDVNLIQKSFKCCGISNKRDGTEDDWIFNYNRLGQGNQPGDEVEMPSDDERGNDEEGETDGEYVGEERETDEEYVDEEEEEDDEGEYEGEEDEEGEYEGEEGGYDDEYHGHYEQRTNYVNVWDD